MVPETQHSVPVCGKQAPTHRVSPCSFGMLSAVNFDYKPYLTTAEISDELTNRHLAPKFPANLSAAQMAPQLGLCFGHRMAQCAGFLGRLQ